MNTIYDEFSHFTFLNVIEQQATRIFNPQSKIAVAVEQLITIEINILTNKPDA